MGQCVTLHLLCLVLGISSYCLLVMCQSEGSLSGLGMREMFPTGALVLMRVLTLSHVVRHIASW